MKIKIILLISILVQIKCLSYSQVKYIIRLFATTENKVSIKGFVNENFENILSITSEILCNELKKQKTTNKQIELTGSYYRTLFKTKTDKHIEMLISKASKGLQYQKSSAGKGYLTSLGPGSLEYKNKKPVKVKIKN